MKPRKPRSALKTAVPATPEPATSPAQVPLPSLSEPELVSQVSRLKEIAGAFTGIPVRLSLSPYGPAPLHLVSSVRGALGTVDVYLREEHVPFAVRALRAWPSLRPCWRAWLDERHPLALEWTAGYISAWRQVFGRGGLLAPPEYVPLEDHSVEQDSARREGFEEFVRALSDQGERESLQVPEVRDAADQPQDAGPSVPESQASEAAD